jgi:hypothetical protein
MASLKQGISRLRNDELRRAYRNAVADLDGFLKQTFCREVFAECSPWQVNAWKLLVPEGVMFRWININSLIGSSVHRKIRLIIAFQVELPDWNAARDRRLEDGGGDDFPPPQNFARESHVDR